MCATLSHGEPVEGPGEHPVQTLEYSGEPEDQWLIDAANKQNQAEPSRKPFVDLFSQTLQAKAELRPQVSWG